MTRLINVRDRRAVKQAKAEGLYVPIHRPSMWGNPFHTGEDGTREEVIAKYEAWIRSRPVLLAAIPQLTDKILGCWCAPKPCHGDVLIKLVKELA
jgi:hypothetical protein